MSGQGSSVPISKWTRKIWPHAWVLILVAASSLAGYVVVWPGTRVCGGDVGWTWSGDLPSRLQAVLRWDERKVVLAAGSRSIEAMLGMDLGVQPDLVKTAELCRRPLWLAGKRDIPLLVKIDPVKFGQYVASLSREFFTEPVDARFGLKDGRVCVMPERAGEMLDVDKFREFLTGPNGLNGIPEKIELPLSKTPPKITAEELSGFLPMVEISSYETTYADGSDRSYNIELGCKALAEVTIMPGQTISFNELVGPRTKERGYRKAPTFTADDTVDDYGGGVCQISTTMYVSLLKAGFGVAERYCHFRPVGYVPLGFDATVSYGYLDLKMTNTWDWPCLFSMSAGGGRITAKVFGKGTPGLAIEIESTVLREIPAPAAEPDPSPEPSPAGSTPAPDTRPLPPAQTSGEGTIQPQTKPKPKPGYLVETVRKFYKDGKLDHVEKLDTSMYEPEIPKGQ